MKFASNLVATAAGAVEPLFSSHVGPGAHLDGAALLAEAPAPAPTAPVAQRPGRGGGRGLPRAERPAGEAHVAAEHVAHQGAGEVLGVLREEDGHEAQGL